MRRHLTACARSRPLSLSSPALLPSGPSSLSAHLRLRHRACLPASPQVSSPPQVPLPLRQIIWNKMEQDNKMNAMVVVEEGYSRDQVHYRILAFVFLFSAIWFLFSAIWFLTQRSFCATVRSAAPRAGSLDSTALAGGNRTRQDRRSSSGRAPQVRRGCEAAGGLGPGPREPRRTGGTEASEGGAR
jgi:hypothetical protein